MYCSRLFVPLHPDMQKQKKILFLHGFYASGSCVPALALKEAFEKRATVLTPDLPLHPADAVRLIRDICDQEKPDILVGNSCGSFYAQMISPIIGVPALLGNPHFKMSDFLRERIGNHQYKSPRADGKQDFTIDEQLISEFEEMEAHQFACCNIYNKVRVWGLFGEEDRLVHLSRCSWSIITTPFTFPVAIPQRQSSSRHGMYPLLRNCCWNILFQKTVCDISSTLRETSTSLSILPLIPRPKNIW